MPFDKEEPPELVKSEFDDDDDENEIQVDYKNLSQSFMKILFNKVV